ncbi:MAG: YkuJ family protein [Alkalibacterium sp.]|nr:YkuJ family protein [Alkalibacterium sp.]
MEPSQLIPVIKRLEAMREDQTGELQVRRFERNGQEKCIVRYDNKSNMFELEDRINNQTYEFDNIDYVAVEILEQIQPAQTSTER